ncbi:MAG: neutral/alkaline non-lysosomal ceramidase N-terminal domain-containing protein [Verrucomicrobiales bacterium]|nr:neutral/alkaline non-lysosomal ceramidase N-terminal domain-containing protein [Verrucomicrobiales bacterium]
MSNVSSLPRRRPSGGWLFLLCALLVLPVRGAGFEVGVARVSITPPTPFWMSGYAARTHPSEGVLAELWAKALAFRDPQGQRVVLVTTDLIGLPRHVSDAVVARAQEKFGLGHAQLLLNSSHTHCGPTVGRNLSVLFDFDAAETARVHAYADDLTAKLVALVGDALRDLAPAEVAVGHGEVGFAINRRQPTPQGVRIGVNSGGPVDHDVPVVRIQTPDGRLRAVLFGYACHNTTLGGDFYHLNGDYAGFAQAEFEQAHPGVTGLFLMLCGGDQNPHPRGTVELAKQHGADLAAEVRRVLATPLKPVRPPLRLASQTVPLEFAAHTRALFEAEAAHTDVYRQRRARLMLEAYDKGEPVRQVAFPLQAVRFGEDLTVLGLGGEVVVGYGLRAKQTYPDANLVVAGYCHDVMCYIPTRRVLEEGGYEPDTSMIYYGQPGPFTPAVEETIFAALGRLLEQVGVKPAAREGR